MSTPVLAEAETRMTEEVGATTEEKSSYRFIYDYGEKHTFNGLAQRMQPFYRFAPLGLFQILSTFQSMTRIVVVAGSPMTTVSCITWYHLLSRDNRVT